MFKYTVFWVMRFFVLHTNPEIPNAFAVHRDTCHVEFTSFDKAMKLYTAQYKLSIPDQNDMPTFLKYRGTKDAICDTAWFVRTQIAPFHNPLEALEGVLH